MMKKEIDAFMVVKGQLKTIQGYLVYASAHWGKDSPHHKNDSASIFMGNGF